MKKNTSQIFMTGFLSNLHPQIANRIENDYWFHRSKWMELILKNIFNFFDSFLGKDYKTLAITATALGGREALISNLRTANDPNNLIFIDDVSTDGIRNNLADMTDTARKKFSNSTIIVDLSNSFGADTIDINSIKADGYLFNPERALGSIPGITLISLHKRVFDRIRESRNTLEELPFVLDILKYDAARDDYSTPFSPDISALVGLCESLNLIKENGGINSHIQKHNYWAKTIRVHLSQYGFKVATKKKNLSNAFTIFICPKELNIDRLVIDLEKIGIIIQKNNSQSIRIGHVGYLPFKNLTVFLKAWQEIMIKHLNISFPIPKVRLDKIEIEKKFENTSKILLAPGPTKYHPGVFHVTKNYFHPGTQNGKKITRRFIKSTQIWLNNGNNPIFASTPSTGLLEASITNLTLPKDRGLIISHGKFGERFNKIAQTKNRQVDFLEIPEKRWGEVFSPEMIKQFLEKDLKKVGKTKTKKISFLCFQQTETSSGVSYFMPHLIEIVRIARLYNPDIMIIMDGVSGVSVHDIDFKKTDIDAVILGSQKGLGVSSGFSFIQLSDRAILHMLNLINYKNSWKQFTRERKMKEYIEIFGKKQNVNYFNFLQLMYENTNAGYASTQSIFHILSTIESIKLIEKQGGTKDMVKKCKYMAKYTRREAEKMNLKVLARAPYQSNSVTPLLLPKKISASDLRKKLENEYGIFIAGAQGDYWKSNMVRIGHMGHITKEDIKKCMNSIRLILSSI